MIVKKYHIRYCLDRYIVIAGMSDGQCSMDTCVGVSSGTASLAPGSPGSGDSSTCTCRCLDHLPAFRDDLHICVDDIHGKFCLFFQTVSDINARSQHKPVT